MCVRRRKRNAIDIFGWYSQMRSSKQRNSPWNRLASEMGGQANLARAFGMSLSTLQRIMAKEKPFPFELYDDLLQLCDQVGVPVPPLDARQRDLKALERLGKALASGAALDPLEVERCRHVYPEEQLIELANSNNTPTSVLMAVTHLLEGT